jgi:REP element-mobilizing transposase RayT
MWTPSVLCTPEGQLAYDAWEWLQETFIHINVDTFCLMPNHTHAIIHILDAHDIGRGDLQIAPTEPKYKRKPLGRLVGAYKTHSTVQINQHRQTHGIPFWQRNYYEHIIRDETGLNRIREYIINNPLNWEQDTEKPANC